jgi:hypothetical protein
LTWLLLQCQQLAAWAIRRLTLNPLIDDLKKAGAFNELKAKQLRVWAAIRNKGSAHETESIPLTEYRRAVLAQRRGGKKV